MAGTPTRFEIIEDVSRFQAVDAAWDALAARDPRAHVFQGHPWLWTWLQHYPGAQPFTAVAWRGDNLTAALPLCAYDLGRGRARVRTLRFAADNNSDYCRALSDPHHPEDLAFLWEQLTRRRDWHLIDLRYVPADSSLATLRSAPGRGLRVSRRHQDVAPFIDITTDWRASVPKGHRTEVLRRWRRVQEQGSVTFDVARTPEDADEMLGQLAEMHIARWQGRQETSLFRFADYRGWIHDVCHELLRREQLHFCRLSLDGKPISMALGFLSGRRLLRYTSTFDEAYARFGPVHLLLMAVVDDLRERDLADVHDFGRGGEAYKARWTQQAQSVEHILVARGSAAGLAAYWWAGHLKPFLWKHQRLGTFLRELRRRAELRLHRS